MRLSAALVGNLEQYMAEEAEAAAKAVTSAMQQGADGLKGELRGQVTGAGLGMRLAKTWRSQVYPRGQVSLSAAALVWTKAPKLIDAFDEGSTITAKGKRFLAIPTPDAGVKHTTFKNKRLTPAIWEAETGVKLRFVGKGRHALLVSDGAYIRQPARWRRRKSFKPKKDAMFGGKRYLVIFILVPQARLRKRLDVKKAGDAWIDRVPGLIFRNWK